MEISPAGQYLILDYRMHHGALPLGWLAVVLEECWPMFLVSVTLLLWLFPDGTLPAGRWHRAASAGAVGWLLVGLVTSSRGVLVAAGGDVRIQASGSLANPSPAAFRVLDVVVIAGTLVSWVAWLAIQIPTYRRASGVYRQQLKWLYSGAAIFVFAYFGVFIATLAVDAIPGLSNQSVTNVLVIFGTAALPACLGVAVLKYRLYELNRVVSRVVSYALITALLAGVFAGLVLLATHVLPFKSSVAVAVATLVIAALFNPLRRRVQKLVGARVDQAWHAAALGLLGRLEGILGGDPPAEEVSKAFWHACAGGQRRAAEYLLSRGADLNWEPDYAYGTALDAASGLGTRQENVLTWLRGLGARSAGTKTP